MTAAAEAATRWPAGRVRAAASEVRVCDEVWGPPEVWKEGERVAALAGLVGLQSAAGQLRSTAPPLANTLECLLWVTARGKLHVRSRRSGQGWAERQNTVLPPPRRPWRRPRLRPLLPPLASLGPPLVSCHIDGCQASPHAARACFGPGNAASVPPVRPAPHRRHCNALHAPGLSLARQVWRAAGCSPDPLCSSRTRHQARCRLSWRQPLARRRPGRRRRPPSRSTAPSHTAPAS